MRVLVINSMFVNAVYRRCADELGALPNIDLTIFVPDSWRMNGEILPLDPVRVDAPYRMMTGKVAWRGYENRGFYWSGLVRAFQVAQPEVVFLMEEPFSLFALEVLAVVRWLGIRIPVVFFTWNNLSFERFDYRPSLLYHSISTATLGAFDRGLTANSDGVRVLKEAGFPGPTLAAGYGVDTQAFDTVDADGVAAVLASMNIVPQDRVIGYVGRMKYMKGVDLLIDAFVPLVQAEHQLKLLLIGNGEDEGQLRKRCKDRGIESSVRTVRSIPQREVPRYMKAIDILVLPSRRVGMWAEQFGRVLVEAMAAGSLVVGSTSGAIPEVIGDCGFVFDEDDSEDLTRVLLHVLNLSNEEKSLLRKNARIRAVEEYSWKRFAERVSGELIAARQAGTTVGK